MCMNGLYDLNFYLNYIEKMMKQTQNVECIQETLQSRTLQFSEDSKKYLVNMFTLSKKKKKAKNLPYISFNQPKSTTSMCSVKITLKI